MSAHVVEVPDAVSATLDVERWTRGAITHATDQIAEEMPVALVYLIFQRRVTQAIMLSAGIKG